MQDFVITVSSKHNAEVHGVIGTGAKEYYFCAYCSTRDDSLHVRLTSKGGHLSNWAGRHIPDYQLPKPRAAVLAHVEVASYLTAEDR